MLATVPYSPQSLSRFQVLLVDDDQEWSAITQTYLETGGVAEVTLADGPARANDALEAGHFDAILADVDLSAGIIKGEKFEQGDEWLLRSLKSGHRPARELAIITAYPRKIKDTDSLARHGVTVAKKATPAEFEYLDRIRREAAELAGRQRAYSGSPAEGVVGANSLTSEVGPAPLMDDLFRGTREVFLEWLRSRSDREKEAIVVHGKTLSIAQIEQEVAGGTQIGRLMIDMYLHHLKVKFKLLPRPFEG